MYLASFRFFVLLDMLSSMLHVGCKYVSKYLINVIFISRIKGQAKSLIHNFYFLVVLDPFMHIVRLLFIAREKFELRYMIAKLLSD